MISRLFIMKAFPGGVEICAAKERFSHAIRGPDGDCTYVSLENTSAFQVIETPREIYNLINETEETDEVSAVDPTVPDKVPMSDL